MDETRSTPRRRIRAASPTSFRRQMEREALRDMRPDPTPSWKKKRRGHTH